MIEIPAWAAEALELCQSLVVLTGAGISAESGIPTFRDAMTGHWANFRPEELASPAGFANDPGRVWRWYAERRRKLAAVAPNAGHRAIVAMARRVPKVTVVTQNVDGLHQRAGSREVIELHGNLASCLCFECGLPYDLTDDPDEPPLCPACFGLIRPAVVWFGELLPADAMAAAETAVETADLLLCVGTSAMVYPAAALPHQALARGLRVIEVNPAETPLTPSVDAHLHGSAGEILPAFVAAAWPDDETGR